MRTYFLLVCFFCFSCDLIVEPLDVTKEQLVLHSPEEGSVLRESLVYFGWEAFELYSGYRIQVVTPNFKNPEIVLIDSLIYNSNYIDTLIFDKTYEWRVRLENPPFKSNYFSKTFELKSKGNISDEKLNLLAPIEGIELDSLPIIFTWEPIINATHYRFQIAHPNFSNPKQVVRDTLTSLNSFSEQNLSPNKSYEWRVRGENEDFTTDYNKRAFLFGRAVDISAVPISIISPKENLLISGKNVQFIWSQIKENHGIFYYRLYC